MAVSLHAAAPVRSIAQVVLRQSRLKSKGLNRCMQVIVGFGKHTDLMGDCLFSVH